MKKTTYIISVILLLLVGSCTNEMAITPQNEQITFSSINASMADLPTSRTHLENGNRAVWDLNDLVGVFSDTQTSPVQFICNNVDNSNASFISTEEEEVSGSNFFAFYPYDFWENSNITDGKIHTYLENYTTHIEESFYPRCPIVAKSSTNKFQFKQTCGIIRFSISGGQTIKKLTLKTNNGETITGRGYIDIYSDAPTFIITESCGNLIEMSANKKISPNESASFYFIVPVMKIESGITLEISGETDEGKSFTFSKSTNKCINISRGVIKSFNVINTDELIEDYQADVYSKLMALYNATGGDNWTNNTNWGSDKPFKEWYGITADDIFISKIDLSSNNLTGSISGELDGLAYLQELYVNSNFLTSIKIESCPNLNCLDCYNNQLKTLDVFCNSLYGINCNDNILENLNVKSNNIGNLNCYNNQLKTLDLSGCPNMAYLTVDYNKLINIDISPCTKLVNLSCDNNPITELCIPKHEYLQTLSCRATNLENLNISDCKSLTHLLCDHNKITSLNVNNCPEIEVLWCHENSLTTLDVTEFTKLRNLLCGEGNNALTTLDISKNIQLEEFSCYGMKLTSLDVSNNTKLKTLECSENPIQSLDVSNLANLTELWCHTMNLSGDLDVSNNANLDFLRCEYNPELAKIYIASSEQTFDYYKDATTKFCIKGSDTLYDEFPYYTSIDYSMDGDVSILQQATIGKGIDIVLMGDAFTDRLIADGTYENTMKYTMEKFFSIEPYTSFRNYFNVYAVTAVSKNDLYANNSSTALSCSVGGGGDDNTVFTYVQKAIEEERIEDAVIIVIQNEPLDEYTSSGLCKLYTPSSGVNDLGKGANISYICLGSVENVFEGVLHHEAGGHGFAKLGDEYATWTDMTNLPDDKKDEIKTLSSYGWLKNLDLVNNPSTIKWRKFLNDIRYSNEDIGIFEGGYEYNYGVYRPSMYSKMENTFNSFNAPSREAIYYRIHKLAYGEDWEYDYEKFVEYDAINRNPVASRSVRFQQMPPMHEPVIIKGSWKDAKNYVPTTFRSVSNVNNFSKENAFHKAFPTQKTPHSNWTLLPDGRKAITNIDASGKISVKYVNE